AQAHNMPVARAGESAAKWNKLDRKIRDLADMTAAVKIGCSWCRTPVMNSAFGLIREGFKGRCGGPSSAGETADRSKISDPAVTFLAASRHGSDERNPAVGSGHQVKEADMAAVSILLSRQSQRLLQIGVALLLLLSLEGFAIPHLVA